MKVVVPSAPFSFAASRTTFAKYGSVTAVIAFLALACIPPAIRFCVGLNWFPHAILISVTQPRVKIALETIPDLMPKCHMHGLVRARTGSEKDQREQCGDNARHVPPPT